MIGGKLKGYTIKYILALFFTLLCTITSEGQPEVFSFHKVTSRENLSSQSYNYYVFKDSRGFVWISSIDGLNRFDGYSVKQYLPKINDPHALADGNIQSMFFEDARGDLWFSTIEALHRYDRKNDIFEQIQLNGIRADEPKDYQVLYADQGKNELWVREGETLYIYPIDTPDQQRRIGGSYSFSLLSYIQRGEDPATFLLVLPDTSGVKIVTFDEYRQREVADFHYEKPIPGFLISTVFLDNSERMWVGGTNGLVYQDLKSDTYHLYNQFKGKPVTGVTGIVPYGVDGLLVTTRKTGMFIFDIKGKRFSRQIYSHEGGRTVPFLYPVERARLDSDGNLWLSAAGQGVFYSNLNKRKFKTYGTYELGYSDELNNVRSIAEDRSGNLWCLTRNGIFVLDKDGVLLPGYERYQGNGVLFSQGEPYFIYCDRSYRIWVCSQKGLFVLSSPGGAFQQIAHPTWMGLPGFIFIDQLDDGRLLVSSLTNGVFEVVEENHHFRLESIPETSDADVEYTRIYQGSSGQLFFCQNNSNIQTFRANGKGWRRESQAEFKPMVNGILDDPYRNKRWVASSAGLFYSDLDADTLHLIQDTLFPNLPINGFLIDDNRYLWLATNHGLIRYAPDKEEKRMYTPSDGLQAWEFNFWAALKTKSGRLIFGGVNGVNIISPGQIEDLKVISHPVLTEILVNNLPVEDKACFLTGAKNISEFKGISLKYYENSLSFRFAALEYSDPSFVQYRYRLEELEDDWGLSGPENFVRYPNLNPGHYILSVDASNSDGAWLGQPARIEIEISPPWYKTRLFRVSMVVAGLIILYLFYRARINQIRKEAEFRQREAEVKQKVAETETAILRLQMNPHFIFNSMNSINAYILNRDINTASDYLGRFAVLMRMILNLAAKPFISISEEMEFIKRYLQSEAMRFENKLTYQFEVDDQIDPDDVIVPTMILQPFVENAIWHGLSRKKGGGQILIRIKKEGQFLVCMIEDNGVGRAEAAKAGARPGHESKALSITMRRLELLEKQEGEKASCEIIDLTDPSGRPAGTRVVLRLPIL